jgi:two-component system, sensor histidine kinase and response regulator
MIFMDVQMPEMDGYEATELIRKFEKENIKTPSGEVKRVPIIAMTANVFREDIEKCLAAGMDSHIGKPLTLEDMLDRLRKYL